MSEQCPVTEKAFRKPEPLPATSDSPGQAVRVAHVTIAFATTMLELHIMRGHKADERSGVEFK